MEIEFGDVQEYNIQRGFGFVSRTFKSNHRSRKGVWFHITKVKYNYPELAIKLDAGSWENVSFWYEINNTEDENISKIWLEANDIPDQQRNELFAYIEPLWRNIDNSTPQWLDKITLALVGQIRIDELNKERKNRIRERKEAEEQEQKNRKPLILQPLKSRIISQNHSILGRRNTSTYIVEQKEPKRVYIGLPESLIEVILWVSRKYRKNPLSHKPGGSDVVVEYHDGRAFGYDWIKRPPAYIETILARIVEHDSDEFQQLDEKLQLQITKSKIARFFARKYSNEDEYSIAAFAEVWNSETSNELPWKALQKFEYKSQNKYDFEQDFTFKPQSELEYYGYEPEYEDPIDKAERLYDIPDPRLVED